MAVTTLMKDSQVGDDWIRQVCAANKPQFVLDASGKPNGNILTGPVRLAFTDGVFEKKRKMESDPNSKEAFGCTILYPPPSVCDMSVLWGEYCRVAQASFAQHPFNAQTGQFAGLVPPWRDQGEKVQFGGYTPGSPFQNISSNYKPAVVDMRMNPIVDPSQIYAGCWAIVAVTCFAGGIGKPKKGPMFGLQTIMKIADDTSLAGAAPDPRTMYGSVNVTPPTGPVAAQFGAMPTQSPQQQFGIPAVAQVYGQPPQQGYGQPQAAPDVFNPADFT